MEKIEMMNKLIESLGVEKTLEKLVDALGDDEMQDNFEFICRMNDIPMNEEEEEENEKITLEEFFESDELLAIHCKTEEEANTLLRAFDELGKKWSGGTSYLEGNCWQHYKEGTCYTNYGMYANKEYYLDKYYQIYEFENVKIEG